MTGKITLLRMADVFISYASEDKPRVSKIATAVEACDWSVWWDRKIIAGHTFDEVIERELEAAKSVVVLWSKDSISSEWVKNEASVAADRGILVPAMIDKVKLPLAFRRKQTVDLVGWDGQSSDERFKLLCDGVAAAVTGEIPKRRHTPSFDPKIWITRIILSSILILIVWLIKNSFFYYEYWFNYKNFQDFLNFTSIVQIISILTAFGLLKKISFIEFLNKNVFFRSGYKSFKMTFPVTLILSVIIVMLISKYTPYLEVCKIEKLLYEIEKKSNLTLNFKDYSLGTAQPENGHLLIKIDTKKNTFKNYKIIISLAPFDKVKFAQILTHRNLGFELPDDYILPDEKSIEEGLTIEGRIIIDNEGKKLNGQRTEIRLRWTRLTSIKNVQKAFIKVKIEVGRWSDDKIYYLYDT